MYIIKYVTNFFDDDEKPYPGLREFYDATFKFFNEVNSDCYDSDSDFDSDSDSDSD